ncbi:unnamed protein product [Mytilus coruscus]|uniref:B box-type domain-containing protein n=1 Tax=Mytilus coruscus TaxID=42192 RepID=A0A6J8C4Q2_MYTCO|nr:unnamed protein product [Mytilus coruscus]
MAERCHICRFDIQITGTTYICLKCHTSVCCACQSKHFIEGNDHLPGFRKYSLDICQFHKCYRDIFCKECDEVVCCKCLTKKHKQHKHDNFERIASTLASSKFPAVKRDLDESKKAVQKLDSKIKKRQKIWQSFLQNVLSVETLLDKQYRQIEVLFFRKKDEVRDIVYGADTDVAVFTKQTRNLKVARTIEHEKERFLLEALDVMTKYKNSKEFVRRYLQFRNDVQNCVTVPQTVGDEKIPTLQLNYDHHSISDIEEVLPCIWFGNQTRNSKRSAKTKRPDYKESELDDLKDELTKKDSELGLATTVIELMTENTRKLCEACEMPNSSVQFEEPPNLHKLPGIQTSYQTFSQCMYGIKRNLREWNTMKQESLEQKAVQSHRDMREHSEVSQERLHRENTEMELKKWHDSALQMQDSVESLQRKISSLQHQLKEAENDKEDLKTRLSQIAGAKLTAGNSNIADLGDKYRPTRIAEIYSETYDSEWTEAMDNAFELKKGWSEEMIIRNLLIVLQVTKYAEKHFAEVKQLKDARKGTAPDVAIMLKEKILANPVFKKYCTENKHYDKVLISELIKTKYAERCVFVSWLMVVQDPEMYIDEQQREGDRLDKDKYKEYTQSGKTISFNVWPALYLCKDGPLLIKKNCSACLSV